MTAGFAWGARRPEETAGTAGTARTREKRRTRETVGR